MKRYELTTDEWKRIEPLLPPKKEGRGRPLMDNRIMLNGMLWYGGKKTANITADIIEISMI